jgi:hypothetical protein
MTSSRSLVVAALFATATIVPAEAQEARFHYGVKFVCGVAKNREKAYVIPGRYLTEINIGNPHGESIKIEKYTNTVLLGDDKAIREPELAEPGKPEGVEMKERTATSDDCAAIGRMIGVDDLGNKPITIGFLNIISNVELNVTAVYTTGSLTTPRNTAPVPGIAVEKIAPVKIKR